MAQHEWGMYYYVILPWTKKRTIIEICGEKNAVPRVISCSIRRDQRRASPIRDCPRLLPCADRAWLSMISHVEQRSSRRESRGWFFFLSRVVDQTWLPPSPVILWIELGGKSKWLPLNFGHHDVMRTVSLRIIFQQLFFDLLSSPLDPLAASGQIYPTKKRHFHSLFDLFVDFVDLSGKQYKQHLDEMELVWIEISSRFRKIWCLLKYSVIISCKIEKVPGWPSF